MDCPAGICNLSGKSTTHDVRRSDKNIIAETRNFSTRPKLKSKVIFAYFSNHVFGPNPQKLKPVTNNVVFGFGLKC